MPPRKIIRRKRTKRNIKTVNTPETAAERQTKSAVSFIMRNSQYPLILKAIRAGTPLSKIAEWGVNRGIFEVNQKPQWGIYSISERLSLPYAARNPTRGPTQTLADTITYLMVQLSWLTKKPNC